jgi:tetratricopeptide (TPR) repeat protein
MTTWNVQCACGAKNKVESSAKKPICGVCLRTLRLPVRVKALRSIHNFRYPAAAVVVLVLLGYALTHRDLFSSAEMATSSDLQQTELEAIHKAAIATTEQQFQDLFAAGRYPEALVEAQKLETTVKARVGERHVAYAAVLNYLGAVYQAQGKYGEAEQLVKRALTIEEQILGLSHPDLVRSIGNLALVYQLQHRYGEAEGLYKRALAIREGAFGPDHEMVVGILENLAALYIEQSNFSLAEPIQRRRLAILEHMFGQKSQKLVPILSELGDALYQSAKAGQAELVFRRALANCEAERTCREDDNLISPILGGLARVYRSRGQYDDAERLLTRVLEIKQRGPGGPGLATTLNTLGSLFVLQGKPKEAEMKYETALAIRQQSLGLEHLLVAESLNNLSQVYSAEGRFREAEELVKRAFAIEVKFFGHPIASQSINNLLNIYSFEGRESEAVPILRQLLALAEANGSQPQISLFAANLSIDLAKLGNTAGALEFSRKAIAAFTIENSQYQADQSVTPDLEGQADGVIEQRTDYFRRHVANLAAAVRQNIEPQTSAGREGLETAQWASRSSTAFAVQQMALRFASGGGALGAVVRESQDLSAQWRERDKALISALSKPESQRNQAQIDAIRRDVAAIEAKLSASAARLAKGFPDYVALESPQPLKAEEVQKRLGADEALVFFLTGDKESYVFALTRGNFDWQTIPVGAKDLSDKVAAFRRGLDVEELTRSAGAGKPVLFDVGLANELYALLFKPVEGLVKDKRHLIVVPTGALTGLPFHLLVTDKPPVAVPELKNLAAYRDAAWLIKRQAVSVLPSVASLKALRDFARGPGRQAHGRLRRSGFRSGRTRQGTGRKGQVSQAGGSQGPSDDHPRLQ